MRLRTRLTAAVVVVSSAGTLLLGGVGITRVRDSQLVAIDRSLTAVTGQVAAETKDQLGVALLAASQSGTPVAIGFAASGSGFTWLRDLPDATVPEPDLAALRAALAGPFNTEAGYRLTAISLRNGETLVVAASMRAIEEQTRQGLLWLVVFWVLLSLGVGLLIRVIVQRDVVQIERLVEAASRIAIGAEAVAIPERASSSEVQTLAHALRAMVESLRASVLAEQGTNQRMQSFLGDASHELRTPLTVIKGYLELLERDVDPQQRERALQRMRAEAARMEMLVNDLLLLAEIGTPVPEVAERIDLTGLVRVLVDDLSELQPSRPVESHIEGGINVEAVPSHLHRAVANAFANIRRHTAEADAVRVTLAGSDGLAILVVEDAGPGLPEELYTRGLTHFQRFDKSRARATGGSGLGMSIIAAVMEELGGSVELARSELGGLRLRYAFPLAS